MVRITFAVDALRLITVVLLGVAAVSSSACAVTTATGSVNVVGEHKIYAYSVWNSEGIVDWFDVAMPEAGARSVIEATCSNPSAHNSAELIGDGSYWTWSNAGIAPDQSVTFYLRTLAFVPTLYSWNPGEPHTLSNWNIIVYPVEGGRGELRRGDGMLPVPGLVPEPSSLAALGLTISGAVGASIRRRRS